MSLAVDGPDANGLQLDKFWLHFQVLSTCVHTKKSKLNGHRLFFIKNPVYIFPEMFKDSVVHG